MTVYNALYVAIVYSAPSHKNQPAGAVVPPHIDIIPTGVTGPTAEFGILLTRLVCVILLSVPALLINTSSVVRTVVANVFPVKKLSFNDVVKVFVVPPVCPSNVKLLALTSPVNANVVGLESFPAVAAAPVILPANDPTNDP